MRKRSRNQKRSLLEPAAGEPDRRTNRLIHEKSPYLLQHAHNPVDWYPWGEEAFQAARREDKPVFLSVGYSTCHWCHVMAHESFEDPQVAALLNETFINIKVDREERPDVDELYMNACQMLTGSGGWPLTLVLTPDKKPFFAGTYFPRESRFGRPGMLELVPRLANLWANRRQEALRSAEQVIQTLSASAAKAVARPGRTLDAFTLDAAYTELAASFDHQYGGFGVAPKFPTPHNFSFLLRYRQRSGQNQALRMVGKTLDMMRLGGLWDHLGYGFHRYSTDERWLVPHFEKMLYDQALLAIAYLETFQTTREERYRNTAQEIFEYVLRDLTGPEGGFYCGEDADSEGVEGKFYLWTYREIQDLLGHRPADVFAVCYGLEPDGNFAAQRNGSKNGWNLPHLIKPLDELADDLKLSEEELSTQLAQSRLKLFQARSHRVHPGLDDKVLADWNGLMIAALSLGARICGIPAYAHAASRAADFILNRLRRPEGRLLHRFRGGEAALPAGLDDYAFLIWGLLELYEADFDVERLEQALDLSRQMIAHFWDEEKGGFYLTADDALDLPVRQKEIYDGALPSGNSVAALDILRLGRITAQADLEDKTGKLFAAFAAAVSRYPAGYTQLLVALDFALGPSFEITIAGPPEAPSTEALLKAVQARFLPHKILLLRPEGVSAARITRLAPYTRDQVSSAGRALAYVCQNYACRLPMDDPDTLAALLDQITEETGVTSS